MSQPREDSHHPASADDDRIARLEAQLSELTVVLEAERQRHKEEKNAQASKLRLLEARLEREVDEKKPGARPASASGTRAMAYTTPRTADNLFVSPRTDRSGSAAATRKPLQRTAGRSVGAGASSARGRTAATASSNKANASGTSDAGSPRAASAAAGAAAGLSVSQRKPTALQHAWDKFCVRARDQFTPKELGLVSAETLQALLEHYKMRSHVERAQVEAQWALIQEGKDTVGEQATPKPQPNARRPAVKRAQHPAEFDVGPDHNKPKLSIRALIAAEEPKGSNPNESTSASGFVRSHSHTVLLRERTAGPSDPNDTQSRPGTPRLCFKRTQSPGPSVETPRGMRHCPEPNTKEYTPRGIRSNGNTHMGGDNARAEGIKTGIDGTGGGATPRRGVRTYDSAQSPTRHRRYSVHVNTPPHLERSTLLSGTLARGNPNEWEASRRASKRPSAYESRVPYALDPVPTANRRAAASRNTEL